MTQLRYSFTDGCGGVAHCHAYIHLLMFLHSDSANRHILGCEARGGAYDPQIRTRARFLYNAPSRQISSLYVQSFGSYRVDKQTNRFCWKHPLCCAPLRRWVKTTSNASSTTEVFWHSGALQIVLLLLLFIMKTSMSPHLNVCFCVFFRLGRGSGSGWLWHSRWLRWCVGSCTGRTRPCAKLATKRSTAFQSVTINSAHINR